VNHLPRGNWACHLAFPQSHHPVIRVANSVLRHLPLLTFRCSALGIPPDPHAQPQPQLSSTRPSLSRHPSLDIFLAASPASHHQQSVRHGKATWRTLLNRPPGTPPNAHPGINESRMRDIAIDRISSISGVPGVSIGVVHEGRVVF
jgi:hypothetical protein